MMATFGIATNACLTDAGRLRHTVPSWIRTFGSAFADLLIVVDRQPPVGRIAALHGGHGTADELSAELERLQKLDARIRIEFFDPGEGSDRLARQWFGRRKPIRCQAGTPILAFVAAIAGARTDLVLRVDCDMLFHEGGWLNRARAVLVDGAVDILEPPRLGESPGPFDVSTRAVMLRGKQFAATRLPLTAHRLDPLRRLHRVLKGRPTWLALEQMLSREARRGRLTHRVLSNAGDGCSLHVPTRQDVALPGFDRVVERVERGDFPREQSAAGWNFAASAWREVAGLG